MDLNLANSNLEIMPGGDYVGILEQKEHPSVPFFTKFGQGLNARPDGSPMEPGQSQTVEIYVEAPADAREGDVNILQIRVSDATVKEWRYFKFHSSYLDLQIMMSNQPIVGTFPPMEAFP